VRILGRWTTPAAALALALLPSPAPAAQGTPPNLHAAAAPGGLLDRPAHGGAALAALGDRVGEAARRNHVSPAHLTQVLGEDGSAWLDTSGRMFYVDQPPAGAAPVTAEALPPAGTDVFTLHSRPSAHTRIYLDFDGAEVSNTQWNDATDQAVGTPARVYAGYSIDGDPTTFSTAERDVIASTWAEVAEDYAPFRVDVTTQDPGDAKLRRSSTSDADYGMRVLVTGDAPSTTTLCQACSGIAYVDVFDEPTSADRPFLHQPAWVFASTLQDNPHYLADAISHEVGHTFGLDHDGMAVPGHPVDDYYKQPGTWAPIMGAAYNPLSEWSNGDYPNATNTQDDLAVIAAHGAPLASDDHGGSPGSATALAGGPASDARGSIGSRTDVDLFKLPACTSPVTVHVSPDAPGPDLDVGVRVLDGDGTTTLTSAPAGRLDADVVVPARTAASYVEVDGTGDVGYSDYGSLGRYTLAVGACAGAPPSATVPSAPVDVGADPVEGQRAVELSWSPPASGAATVTGYVVRRPGLADASLAADARSYVLTGLSGNTDYPYSVTAVNAQGEGVPSAAAAHTPAYPPSAPLSVAVSAGTRPGEALLGWAAPLDQGGGAFTGYDLQVTPLEPAGDPRPAEWVAASEGTTRFVGGLVEGQRYRVTLWALYDNGPDDQHARGDPAVLDFTFALPPTVQPPTGTTLPPPAPRTATRPGAPRIGRATPGAAGGRVTATARWSAAPSGGSPVTAYKVVALRMSATGHVVRRTGFTAAAAARAKVVRLPKGRYRFTVAAVNRVGTGRASARSGLVAAR
jgi:hypothetical protein